MRPYNNLPDCYIFDIDGTFALLGDRSPYDESEKMLEDVVNRGMFWIYEGLTTTWYGERDLYWMFKIFFVTGRSEKVREITAEWLRQNVDNSFRQENLLMRPEGDKRPDYIVKKELYEKNIRGKYNVLGIFEDRTRVVKMWRELRLPCYQVAEGDF